MKKIEWNKVTWYSKLIAVFLFFVVLMVGIYIGSDMQELAQSSIPTGSRSDAPKKLSTTHDIQDTIFPLLIHNPTTSIEFDNARYQCGNRQIIPQQAKGPDGKPDTRYAESILFAPDNYYLPKPEPTAIFTSYTFSKNCEKIYAIVQTKTAKDVYEYDVYGNYERLTENLFPVFNAKDANEYFERAKPDPYFVYAVDNDKLLVSFIMPTTGFEEVSDFTTHRLFSISEKRFTKDIEFIEGYTRNEPGKFSVLPPAILNFKDNILSYAVWLAPEKKLVRKDYDLKSEKIIKTVPLNPALLEGGFEKALTDKTISVPLFNCQFSELGYDACWLHDYKDVFPE